MIANCPTCGTQYKHRPPAAQVRARCVRCDATLLLARLKPYRIVPVVDPSRNKTRHATRQLPIGLDHPDLATSIARNVARNAPTASPIGQHVVPDDDDPLPPIREMAVSGAFESSVPLEAGDGILTADAGVAWSAAGGHDVPQDGASSPGGRAATFALWLATGAIAGTGASWTLGGTTMTGITAGAALGALAGWGWRQWTSPN